MGHVVNGTPVDIVLMAQLSLKIRNESHSTLQAA